MKLALIILLKDNENQLKNNLLIEQLELAKEFQICFVDNKSNDATLESLYEIKDQIKTISIVEVKKRVSTYYAQRAGSRFISNNFNLKHIGYIDVNEIISDGHQLYEVIELIRQSHDNDIDFNTNHERKYQIRSTHFRRIFSVSEFIKMLSQPNYKLTD